MGVSKSSDGGATWGHPITLRRDRNPQVLNDKNSITADPTNSNFVYAVWDRLRDSGAQQPTSVFFKGPVFFARTTNSGQSWQRAKNIYDPGANAQTIANQIVVLPNGVVIDFFTEVAPNGGTRIGLLRSSNRGATFSGPSYAAVIATVLGVVTPDAQFLVRDASILFDVAVDSQNGNLYLVWQDVRFHGIDEVAF
jgi:hypothetical protein